jgi:hypothetical protein
MKLTIYGAPAHLRILLDRTLSGPAGAGTKTPRPFAVRLAPVRPGTEPDAPQPRPQRIRGSAASA